MSKKEKKSKKYKLDSYHYHEALDRSYLVANLLEEALVDHPVYKKHKILKKNIKEAQRLILESYQIIGGLDIKLFPDKKKPHSK